MKKQLIPFLLISCASSIGHTAEQPAPAANKVPPPPAGVVPPPPMPGSQPARPPVGAAQADSKAGTAKPVTASSTVAGSAQDQGKASTSNLATTTPSGKTTPPATSGSPAGTTTPAVSPSVATATEPAPSPAPNPSVIYQKNVFDPQRKPWTLPVEPPPPPPPPPPLTDNDVKVLGAWTKDGVSKALVSLSARMLPPPVPGKQNKPFRTLAVGDQVGSYRLAEITLKELVFETNGMRTNLPFKVTNGRAAAGISIAPPDQNSLNVSAPSPVMIGSNGEVSAVASAPAAPTPEVNMAVAPPLPAPAEPAAAAPAPAPAPATAGNDAPKAGMSLLEAIEYARKNANNTNGANPFNNSNK